MTHILHRHTQTRYPVAVKGDGCYIIDKDGKRYLDGCCGAAVSCVGHSNEVVREAIRQQLDKLAFAHSGFFTTEPMEALADYLVDKAPAGIDRVYFVSGGSEAVEGAIKLARQYFLEVGKPTKHKIIARWQSYHGNTLGALAAGGNKWRRQQFAPLLADAMEHISPCYAYRGQQDGESEYDYGQRVANELEEKIQALGADNVAAFVAEPVVGATMGCVPAVEGYFKRVREICDAHDVLLILDEVMCGMGRTGTLFACEQEGITADIITTAKGLGGGYQPIGAMLLSGRIYDAIADGSGFFQHGHTYIGHALACAASLAVLTEIETHDLLARVQHYGQRLRDGLQQAIGDHVHVGDIRGKGLFVGVEIVEDRMTKAPFSPERKMHARIKAEALAQGLMCYPMGGTINGKEGDHVMFAPPFIIEDAQLDMLIEKFSDTLSVVFQ